MKKVLYLCGNEKDELVFIHELEDDYFSFGTYYIEIENGDYDSSYEFMALYKREDISLLLKHLDDGLFRVETDFGNVYYQPPQHKRCRGL